MPRNEDPYIIDWFAFGRAEGGAPVRWVASGRRGHPVGIAALNKSRYHGIPWESRNVERPALRMLAACSRVTMVNSQPHSLFFGVRGIGHQFRYSPDVEAHVHRSVLEELSGGSSLSKIAAKPFPHILRERDMVSILFEMKSDGDQSQRDPADETKMNMVKEIYRYVDQPFFVLKESEHLDREFLRVITNLESGARDRVGDLERSRALFAFGRDRCLSFETLAEALGGQPKGERLVKALHFKQFLSIDLTRGLNPNSPVWLTQWREIGRDV